MKLTSASIGISGMASSSEACNLLPKTVEVSRGHTHIGMTSELPSHSQGIPLARVSSLQPSRSPTALASVAEI